MEVRRKLEEEIHLIQKDIEDKKRKQQEIENLLND